MSKFLSEKHAGLKPYVPGEQPKDTQYIKLNTNESPFSPPSSVWDACREEVGKLALYSDPESTRLTEKAAEVLGVRKGQVLMTNGSDEALEFAFMAFCDQDTPAVFPDITYGFYGVLAKLYGVPRKVIPLNEDFTVEISAFKRAGGTIFLANPNAPTGLALSTAQIEEILQANPENVVVVDEAYADFYGESCVPLVDKYDNLLVTQTFSKSRSLAGARLGMAIGNEKLIADLKGMKDSTNPYNVNRMTAAVGQAVLCETEWFEKSVNAVRQVREYTAEGLKALGFTVLDSKANFLFAKSDKIGGEELYLSLKAKGILVRHFTGERIKDYNRITVGAQEDMQTLIEKIKEILEEKER